MAMWNMRNVKSKHIKSMVRCGLYIIIEIIHLVFGIKMPLDGQS